MVAGLAPNTPRPSTSPGRDESTDIALRALKELVGLWFSCFTQTRISDPTARSSGA